MSFFLWILALFLLTSVAAVAPAIRAHNLAEPESAAHVFLSETLRHIIASWRATSRRFWLSGVASLITPAHRSHIRATAEREPGAVQGESSAAGAGQEAFRFIVNQSRH